MHRPITWFVATSAGLFLLLLASACGALPAQSESDDEHIGQTGHIDRRSTWPTGARTTLALEPLFRQARILVEQATGADLALVELDVTDTQLIDREVERETRRLVGGVFRAKRFREDFVRQVMQVQVGSYLALYHAPTDSVMISRVLLRQFMDRIDGDRELREEAILSLLIHELVHAADEQQHRIHARRTLDFRASFAQSAVYEGHAQWQARQICKRAGCSAGLAELDRFMLGDHVDLDSPTRALQAAGRNALAFSYIEGERFIDRLASTRESHTDALTDVLAAPPNDPIEILDTSMRADTGRRARNEHLLALGRRSASTLTDWQPLTVVPTSPLKGLDLKLDSANRHAAIHGFTELLDAIVALQIYDESDATRAPLEVTIMTSGEPSIAKLFAESLGLDRTGARIDLPDGAAFRGDANDESVGMPSLSSSRQRVDGRNWYTTVGLAGHHVVQIAGFTDQASALEDYVRNLLDTLEPPG